jgi:tartrate dehydrogenase/decarboxylase/D-malate dehydrogenase
MAAIESVTATRQPAHRDLGGTATTQQVTAAVCARLAAALDTRQAA